jgi:hypothetical protein
MRSPAGRLKSEVVVSGEFLGSESSGLMLRLSRMLEAEEAEQCKTGGSCTRHTLNYEAHRMKCVGVSGEDCY